MDYAKIGQRIRKYRKEKNLSQEQLAERIDISPTHMSHIETGGTKLSLPVLVDIATVLEVNTDKLLFDEAIIHTDTISSILSSCSAEQLKVITAIVTTTKNSLDNYMQ